jgi:hypothetical protein
MQVCKGADILLIKLGIMNKMCKMTGRLANVKGGSVGTKYAKGYFYKQVAPPELYNFTILARMGTHLFHK